MDKGQRDQMTMELTLTLLSTLLFLALYWIVSMPEWKRDLLVMEIREALTVRVADELTVEQLAILHRFRQEISRWEHDNARKR
jgi:hypothetical protein